MKILLSLWRHIKTRFPVGDDSRDQSADSKQSFNIAVRNVEKLEAEEGHGFSLTGFQSQSLNHAALTWSMNKALNYHLIDYFSFTTALVERIDIQYYPENQHSLATAMWDKR